MLIKPKSCYFRGKHTGVSHLFSSRFDLYFHVPVFVSRVISSLQRQLVMTDFTPEFRQKLQDFYRRFLFPVELKNLRNRCVPVHAGCCNSFSFSVIQVTDWSVNTLSIILACAFQPVCPSLGRYFAGDGAEGAKCFRYPKRRKKEGCADWRIFCSFPEKWTTAATKEVQRNSFTTPHLL